MVLSERKKTHSTLWDTYLEIQIAMADMQKKEDEKKENAQIQQSRHRCLKLDYILSYLLRDVQ